MRILTPYEQTQLARHGSSARAQDYGTQPIEYVTGVAEFLGLHFFVSPDVLIPRIETEELVTLALEVITEKIPTATPAQPLQLADIGTGSGAICISLAKHCHHFGSKIQFFASDSSPAALSIAQKNAKTLLSPQEPIITFLNSDLLTQFPLHQLDLIIANLPYIPTSRIENLDPSVRDHEPHKALDGGPDGFSLIRKLLTEAPKHLKPNGVILLEIDDSHSIANFKDFTTYFQVEVFTDSFGKNRFAKLTQHLAPATV